jgi:hypothetical protein
MTWALYIVFSFGGTVMLESDLTQEQCVELKLEQSAYVEFYGHKLKCEVMK